MNACAVRLSVEVVFALTDRQVLVPLTVEQGTTVGEAIEISRIAEQFPGLDMSRCEVGIWGRLTHRDGRVADGDRIEIYRELVIDPREARRRLARAGRTMGRHDGAGDG